MLKMGNSFTRLCAFVSRPIPLNIGSLKAAHASYLANLDDIDKDIAAYVKAVQTAKAAIQREQEAAAPRNNNRKRKANGSRGGRKPAAKRAKRD